mmetsp:Transcript_33341/g.61125  ORF Transcript_33341/g.61125 Transcript_33341/m.61125 type:complete len:218 (-) Transcript_33341:1090-1743(-)
MVPLKEDVPTGLSGCSASSSSSSSATAAKLDVESWALEEATGKLPELDLPWARPRDSSNCCAAAHALWSAASRSIAPFRALRLRGRCCGGRVAALRLGNGTAVDDGTCGTAVASPVLSAPAGRGEVHCLCTPVSAALDLGLETLEGLEAAEALMSAPPLCSVLSLAVAADLGISAALPSGFATALIFETSRSIAARSLALFSCCTLSLGACLSGDAA